MWYIFDQHSTRAACCSTRTNSNEIDAHATTVQHSKVHMPPRARILCMHGYPLYVFPSSTPRAHLTTPPADHGRGGPAVSPSLLRPVASQKRRWAAQSLEAKKSPRLVSPRIPAVILRCVLSLHAISIMHARSGPALLRCWAAD